MSGAAQAREALDCIDASAPRDAWVRALMAAKAAGVDEAAAEQWSAHADNFNERDFRATWRSIKPEGGIGPGTLFAMAREAGWKARNGATRSQATPGHGRHAKARSGAAKQPSAAEVWARFEPATDAHPYIAAKCGIPDGLRVVPAADPLHIAGVSVAGWLAVPARPIGGSEPVSVQLIPPPGVGKKLNLPGASIGGAVFPVGELIDGGTIYLCEGVGQAWACWKATGHASLCCFGWGNVRKVAAELRRRDDTARLVLVPDAGKEDDAREIAADVSAAVACMPERSPPNFDANDFGRREGFDALELLLAGAEKPITAPPLFEVVPFADLSDTPPPAPAYWWHGYLPIGVVTMLSAHGGTGKSTIALMLAVCIATGRDLFGKPTRAGRVLYFSGEDGAALVRYRLHLVCRAMGVAVSELRDRVHILDATAGEPTLFHEVPRAARTGATTPTYAALANYIEAHQIDVVILDNASDTFDGNEIARSLVRGFMRSLLAFAKPDKAVLLLAHVDKNTARNLAGGTDSYSGSTAWHNSARSRLYLSRDKDGALLLEHQKHNLAAKPEPALRLLWPEGGIPTLDAPVTGFVQAIDDRNNTKALLKLIHEFTERGEFVSTATTSRTHAGKLLRSESGFPARLKDSELFDLLRQAERRDWVARVSYAADNRHPKERWQVTSGGAEVAEIRDFAPTAPTAPTSKDDAVNAVNAERTSAAAPTAPTSALGGVGECARAKVGAKGGA